MSARRPGYIGAMSIHLQKVQTLLESKNEVLAIRQHFEDAHVAYISKSIKIECTDDDQRAIFNNFMDRAQEVLDNISVFLLRNKEEKEAETLNDLYQEILSEMSEKLSPGDEFNPTQI